MRRRLVPIVLVGFVLLWACYPSLTSAQTDRPGSRMEEYLNLTLEQKTKLDESRKARQEERRIFVDQMRKLRSELRESMKAPQADEKKIEGLIDEMTQLRSAQLKNSFRNARDMKKIFSPEQLEKLEKMKDRFAARRGARFGIFGMRGNWFQQGWRHRPYWGRGFAWRSRLWQRWW